MQVSKFYGGLLEWSRIKNQISNDPSDVHILVPVLPILFVAITWFLPWERWIPWDELSLHVLGLYLLYAAFAF